MKHEIIQTLEDNSIIIAIKNNDELEKSLDYENPIVFTLYGDICTISENVNKLKEHGKTVIIHEDLISGLSSKEIINDFIKTYTKADGIITTHPNNINRAKELGLFTVLRFFIIDSLSLENMKKTLKYVKPDAIEILPGVMPKVLENVVNITNIPVIAGGLISDKQDVINAFKVGATAISSSNMNVWAM